MAEALGGTVGLASAAEVGVCDVDLTTIGKHHGMTAGLPSTLPVMQWHHAEVTELPEGAEVLASSPTTAVQIMSVGECLLGTQFHAELTPALVDRWAHIPQYLEWLEAALGPNAYERVKHRALPLMPAMRAMSERLFSNLLRPQRRQRAAA